MAVVATDPIDRSKPPTTSVAVTPSARMPVIDTDWKMKTALCGEAKPLVIMQKYTIMPKSSVMKPYLMASSRGVSAAAAGAALWVEGLAVVCSMLMSKYHFVVAGNFGQKSVDIDAGVAVLSDQRMFRHHQNAVGDLEGFIQLGEKYDRCAPRCRRPQFCGNIPACGNIDTLERLVEDQQA